MFFNKNLKKVQLFFIAQMSYKYVKFANMIGGRNGGIGKKSSKSEMKKHLQNSYYY